MISLLLAGHPQGPRLEAFLRAEGWLLVSVEPSSAAGSAPLRERLLCTLSRCQVEKLKSLQEILEDKGGKS